ncbi:DUF397 domain-containing protein [Streptomyces flavofungini]|uniref:DUF397 domain-containing protein n=1 Tax=Streptomyces flavofungini TaxID=68200 RepID=UPI0025AFF951|nr:DUF397 domain-containing protein [Streptomyces flavofungini]WJV47807.1 DUF397 domain-containing protein [Streptomyces flavofungini]
MPEPTSWQKSSYCGSGDSCIHVSASPTGQVRLTESAAPAPVMLSAPRTAFAALLRAAKESPNRA